MNNNPLNMNGEMMCFTLNKLICHRFVFAYAFFKVPLYQPHLLAKARICDCFNKREKIHLCWLSLQQGSHTNHNTYDCVVVTIPNMISKKKKCMTWKRHKTVIKCWYLTSSVIFTPYTRIHCIHSALTTQTYTIKKCQRDSRSFI